MDKEKSNKRTREDRDREHKHHRSRDRDEKYHDSDHHHHHHRSEHKSSKREDRESSHDYETKTEKSYDHRDDREESRDRGYVRESKRERSHEPRNEREGSRDRVRDKESRRERSHEPRNEREGSRDRELKREEREGSRYRAKSREVKREDSYEERERENENVSRNKRKDREENEGRDGEKKAKVSEERRERRRFEDKVKEEVDAGVVEDVKKEVKVKEEVNYHDGDVNGGGSVGNGAAQNSATMASRTVPENSLVPGHPLPTKVSSISTTNENRGVSITRSHEVPGKSSTDGSSSTAGKSSGNLSLDALAKAKKALQMQKELSEKLKKIPLLNKGAGSTSDVSPHAGLKEGAKLVSSSSGTVQGSVPSMTPTSAISAGSTSSSVLPSIAAASLKPPVNAPGLAGLSTIPNVEAVKRAQELAAKMGFRQDPEFAPLINLFPGQVPTEVVVPQKPTKAPVLRVDALGREIDEHGNVVNLTKPSNLSTLKVNINKQKKEAFQILKPELDIDPESNPHFDARMGINKNKILRPKRMTFQFVEEGKWSKEAEIIKLKSQFGEAGAKELKAKQAQLAKAKADINPNLIEVSERIITKEKPKDLIPEIEWWDMPLLVTGSYGGVADGGITDDKLKMEKITIYVEHPRPIEPPAEPAPPPPQPLKLTKKEQKKLRTQRRLAREKDKQEMIRQGLIEPPKPKVKMSNLMKVLGSEATQDPTRLEKEIRTAAAEREQAHIDRNTARKLTPAERREKKERKLFDDSNTLETIVSVYKINDLSHPKARYKVDVNARENRLTGCAVISEEVSVVVVEGGSKSIKRYGKLMLRRINWVESVKEEEEGGDGDEDKPVNKCLLVWQGSVAKQCFNRFYIHECMTEAAARKVFADAGVGHYWDLAVNFSED